VNHELICITNEVTPGDDGWAMIAPYGDYPGVATLSNEDGSFTRVRAIQRLDRKAADQMVGKFKSLWGRVRRYVTGAPIYLGHPDAAAIGHRYSDKTPKGMFSDLEARDTGLFGKPVFTNEGLQLLTKFPAMSGRWTADEVGTEIHQGQRVKVFRPAELKSAGLTDKPNLPVELLNEFENEQTDSETNDTMKKETIIALLKKHGVELANDAKDEQLETALDTLCAGAGKAVELANEKTGLESQVAEHKESLKAKDETIGSLTKERDAAKQEFSNERGARIALTLDHALADGRITPAEKPAWKTKLEADFANSSEALAKKTPAMKVRPATAGLGDRKGEGTITDRTAKVQELVNDAMDGGKLSYDQAFAKVRRENEELFNAMKQPAKA